MWAAVLEMDWLRFVLIIQEFIVVCLFMISAYRDWKWSVKSHDSRIKMIYKGRSLTAVGVVILTIGVATAHIDKWSDDLTIRVPISQLAMICLILGWFYAFQRHYTNIEH